MHDTAEALMHQIVYPALPATGAPPIPSHPRIRESAAVLIGRIVHPAPLTAARRYPRPR